MNADHALQLISHKLRDLATNAAHEDRTRWETGHTLGSKSPVVVDDHEKPTVLIETWAKHREQVDAYLTAFASPVVGLAVAEWLGCLSALEPSEYVTNDGTCGWCNTNHAHAIAQAIAGGIK
ncbi:hypothetical protein ACFVYE_32230 [Streptomyces sp. NPDC058239]|uniref:hypothetical protein n=1 Tax=Streptomyces sp. NPDC058239 TaxID=3346395 RepID=UPI0036DFCAB4